MNSQQRKFLIDKITAKVKVKIDELSSQKTETPSLSSFMMHLILSDKFEIKSNEALKKSLRDKAIKGLSSARPENFLGDASTWSQSTKNQVTFKLEDFFILPADFQKALDDSKAINKDIQEQIYRLNIQAESLETRIMLASDKTLQKMINEVDDMGDISLLQTKIKLLE
jgi:hypothetical protein